MSSHEHFRELSALAAIGQLSSSEDRELREHLGECMECRDAHGEYARVVQHQLPQADAIRWRVRSTVPNTIPDAELRDRFLARARAEGIGLSAGVECFRSPDSVRSRWRFSSRPALAAAAAAIVVVSGVALARKYQLVARSHALNTALTAVATENQNLDAQLAALRETIKRESSDLDKMKREKSVSEESLRQSAKQLEEARTQADNLNARLQQAESNAAGLANENHQKEAVVAELRARNDKLHRDNVDNLSNRVLLEAQVRDLTEALRQETANLERERQLMALGKDVRQLMGARNLHILDVHDVDGGGKSARAFGRVFYAENQSLIFYAFDLPSGRLSAAKYNFQAWGQREYVWQSVRNLGTFEVDDHEQHRWILKVNDPHLLQGIDSVFVTAESFGDAKEPRGKKLLYAYIAGQPNHP